MDSKEEGKDYFVELCAAEENLNVLSKENEQLKKELHGYRSQYRSETTFSGFSFLNNPGVPTPPSGYNEDAIELSSAILPDIEFGQPEGIATSSGIISNPQRSR